MLASTSSLNLTRLPIDLKLVRDTAHILAHECGKEILRYFPLEAMPHELKSDRSPVSVVDPLNNQNVIKTIRRNFPHHRILGEEDSLHLDRSDFTWVCDPLDGTCPFIAGIPTSVFSLALTYRGKPIVAILHDPYNGGRTYYAELGSGATLNQQKIQVDSRDQIELTNLLVDDYSLAHYRLSPEVREELQANNAYCWQLFSMGFGATRVASGAFSGAIYIGDKPWDIAAAKLIVEEAGGKVTDLNGNEQLYDQPIQGAIISNGVLHPKLVKVLANRFRVNSTATK